VPGFIEKLPDPLVLFLNIVSAAFELFVTMIGRRIALDRQGIPP
jgi:fumarate reductase subunit C